VWRVGLAVIGVALVTPARAYPPFVDRDFGLDLYVGNVLGSVRIIGMGGANVALVERASGMAINPAAPAVRPTTRTGRFAGAAGLDWLSPTLGNDFDNNGDPDGEQNARIVVAGAAMQFGLGGFGIDLTLYYREIPDVDGGPPIALNVNLVRVTWARTFLDEEVTFGVGARGGIFELAEVDAEDTLVSEIGWSGIAGFLWRPRRHDLRVGASLQLPITLDVDDCPSCDRPVPKHVTVPWESAVGVAWRFGPTAWNRNLDEDYRDERSLTVALDVLFTGAVGDGHGLQRYAAGELQQSGRSLSVSVRGGVEAEVIPGWLRLRGGSYWEPGRLEDRGGRVHGTFGVETRVLELCVFGTPYRLRIAFTGDLAESYGNGGLSVGFW
jgi:hypothetical protein